jgi:hypothetical protein
LTTAVRARHERLAGARTSWPSGGGCNDAFA